MAPTSKWVFNDVTRLLAPPLGRWTHACSHIQFGAGLQAKSNCRSSARQFASRTTIASSPPPSSSSSPLSTPAAGIDVCNTQQSAPRGGATRQRLVRPDTTRWLHGRQRRHGLRSASAAAAAAERRLAAVAVLPLLRKQQRATRLNGPRPVSGYRLLAIQ